MSLGDMFNKMSPIENKLTRDMSQSEYMRLVDRNTELFDENKDLKQRIDKAIEYIEMHTDKLKTTRIPKIDFNYKELLEILDKGE